MRSSSIGVESELDDDDDFIIMWIGRDSRSR